MDYLSLDLSKASLGWARWQTGQPRPTYGSKCLGSTLATRAEVYINLHRLFLKFQLFGSPDEITIEAPRNPQHLKYPTKFENDRLLIGLCEMVYYLGTMIGSRCVATTTMAG